MQILITHWPLVVAFNAVQLATAFFLPSPYVFFQLATFLWLFGLSLRFLMSPRVYRYWLRHKVEIVDTYTAAEEIAKEAMKYHAAVAFEGFNHKQAKLTVHFLFRSDAVLFATTWK